MEGHYGQKCNLIATCIPLDHIRVPLDRIFLPLDRPVIPLDRTLLPLDRTFIPLDRTFVPLDHTFIPLGRTLLPFDRTFIPLDRNYRSAAVTIWSAVKRGTLNLHLMFVWRNTTYDYMTYNLKSSRTWSHDSR